jgi:hypothetical protein
MTEIKRTRGDWPGAWIMIDHARSIAWLAERVTCEEVGGGTFWNLSAIGSSEGATDSFDTLGDLTNFLQRMAGQPGYDGK